ncbi:MAG: alkaline phosphatase [Saprospiraceae bacterium]
MSYQFRFSHILVLLLLNACNTSKINSEKTSPILSIKKDTFKTKPRNIILMIGDGMGLSQITAGMYSNNNKLELERCSHIGLHKAHSSDNLITDSAAGANAFSIGMKTKNGHLGLDSLNRSHQTILEEAESKGFATGLVVTSTIVHATPAAFFSHQTDRDEYENIALDLLKTDIDLIIGGGKKYFDRRNNDSLNLITDLRDHDYLVTDYFEQDFDNWTFPVANKIVYFTADGDPLPVSNGRKYLPKATKDAIDFLKLKSEKGFFLMVEGSQIDWGGHANDANYIITEVLDFDQAIKHALDFAQLDQNTLVIITADHETGGFSINSGKKFGELKTSFTSKNHTADLIPVFAFGPGAELFSGIYENTEIYKKMYKLLFSTK